MRLALLSLFAFAAVAHADPVDDIVQAEMKRSKTPGIALVVVRDGQIVREQGYGLANVELQAPVTPATVFQSGSIGKQFTAALVMLLAEDGKLRLDDPIARHLPGTPPAWRTITIRHLLNHTSGMADPEAKIDLRKDYSDASLTALAAAMPLRFQPGQKWEYSNMGYLLLGFICNRAGGAFYGDQLRARIFAPRGMEARIISERDIVPQRAAGYDRVDGQLKNQAWVSPSLNRTADGSLYLTAHDLALWDLALYGEQPLSAASKAASWTPAQLHDGTRAPYGFGWDLTAVNGHRRIAHDGRWQGFTTQISRFTDDRLSVIVLSNSSSGPAPRIASLVAAHYLPALQRAPLADTEPDVSMRVRDIVAHFARAARPPGMSVRGARKLTPSLLKEVAADLRQYGALEALEPVARAIEGGRRRYTYRLYFANEVMLMTLSVNRAGALETIGLQGE